MSEIPGYVHPRTGRAEAGNLGYSCFHGGGRPHSRRCQSAWFLARGRTRSLPRILPEQKDFAKVYKPGNLSSRGAALQMPCLTLLNRPRLARIGVG